MRQPSDLTKLMHEQIPLSKAMHAEVIENTETGVTLSMPLAPNINHKKTAFGGSVHSAAVLACWALVTEAVKGFDVDYVVIQDSEIDYIEPVESDFTAESEWATPSEREKFLATLQKRGLARARIFAEVRVNTRVCAKLKGRFAAGIVSSSRKSKAK